MTTPPVTPPSQVSATDSAIAAMLTQLVADTAATRTDVAVIRTQLETVDVARADFEARLRVLEQRPSTADIEPRVRGLERWRFSLPTAVGLGIAETVYTIVQAWPHH